MSQTIGLFYGSTTGNTEDVAERVAAQLGSDNVCLHDVADNGLAGFDKYNSLIFGISTWDFGELQEDWDDIWSEVDDLDFSGMTCALFGLGDQIGYPEWFLDAMGMLHEKLQKGGARVVGYWPNQGYDFEASKALTADASQFVGLALDDDGQAGETDERIAEWCAQIKPELGL
ncbi:flavodoxin FldB [Aliamphritea hakodatensis]|uniref:flavodoxin FldB n=1 Tax=Aliamphritea hakodatensis TaxID=2895352 RepID=UPI0022FD80F7|nr:flavodoxin FldB [Aliamphritea hakodatensis]